MKTDCQKEAQGRACSVTAVALFIFGFFTRQNGKKEHNILVEWSGFDLW
jgi:hypothetical protein